jgi:flagellar motor switch protein FliG
VAGGAVVTLTGAQKAAVVLLQLGQERAARVLAHLGDIEVEELTAEIVRLEEVPPSAADAIVQEFHAELVTGRPVAGRGGIAYAHRLLEASFGPERAAGVMDRLHTVLAGQPFDFLHHADPRQIRSLLAGEHPQTIALVLAHLRPERASAVLVGLPAETRADVAHRIAILERTSPEMVAIVADDLSRKATAVIGPGELTAVGGLQPLVQILNRSDPGTEKEILEGIGARDEDLAAEVRSLMFTFEDIVTLDDKAVQLVLRQVDTRTLAMALKGAPGAVADKARTNLSERARENLDEEIELSGRVRVSEVQEARGAIVTVIRALEEAGQIVIRRDGEEDYVS